MKKLLALALLALCAPLAAQVKISGLPAATTPLNGNEATPCVQSGTTSQCTAIAVARSVNNGVTTANQVLATPNGSSGQLGVRALVAADLPTGTSGPTVNTVAGTTYVSTTGSDSNNCLTWLTACATVSQAITNLPANGGLVEVGYGSFACWNYTASGAQQQIRVRGRGIGSFGAPNSASTALFTGNDATVFTNSTAATTCITIAGNSGGQNNPVWILEDFAVVSAGGTAITFTAGPSGTSATLTSNFTGTTGNYVVLLSSGQAIATLMTNGSAAVTFNQAAICTSGGCTAPTANATYITTSNGISISNGTHAVLRRVASKFHGGSGIISQNSYWVEFDTVYGVGNAQYGWDGQSGAGNNNLLLVSNSKFYGNGSSGARTGAGSGSVQTFINTDFSVNGVNGLGYGMQVQNGGPYNFFGDFFETNPQGGLHNNATGTNVNVTGCFFTGNSAQQYGIQALGTTDVYNIIGNEFTGHVFASIDNGQGQGGTIQQNISFDTNFLYRYNGTQSNGSAGHVPGALAFETLSNQTINAQTLSSAGAVTIDASKALYNGGYQQITLAANATSSSITNALTGQVMTVQWIENSTGGFTYAWPANTKFTGGSAPAGTTLSTMNGVTFIYDGTNWVETSRSTAVPYP